MAEKSSAKTAEVGTKANTPGKEVPVNKQNKFKYTLHMMRLNVGCYGLLAPFMILFTVFTIIPVIISLPLGFTNFNMVQFPKFVGLSNFYTLFLNDDMYVLPHWDKVLYDEIKKMPDNLFFLSSTTIQPHTPIRAMILADYGDSIENFREEALLTEYMNYPKKDWIGATWPPNIVHKDVWDLVGGYSIEYTPGMYSDPDFTAKLWFCGVRVMKGLQASRVYHFETKSTSRIRKNCGQMQFLLKWGITASTLRKYFTHNGEDYHPDLMKCPENQKGFRFDLIRCHIKAVLYLLSKSMGPLHKLWK